VSENKSALNWTFCQLLMKNPIVKKKKKYVADIEGEALKRQLYFLPACCQWLRQGRIFEQLPDV
jgi:hypothetical protein